MRKTSFYYSNKLNNYRQVYQGGEKKVMRKSLAILLAITLVFSMFGSLAYAADELTAQQKYDALAAKGIFVGINGEAALDQPMNRAQFARVVALIKGLDGIGDPDTRAVTVKPFSDIELGLWYTEEIDAVKESKDFEGNPDGTFNPNGDIKVQELAIVVAKVLGLEPVVGAQVEGAADWAAGHIQAILNNGLPFPTNYTEAALRSDLASLAFTADAIINPAVATSFTAAATAAKKITVTFNSAVDTSKVTATLWNGSNQVNAKSTTFADDKKSVVLEFANNLPAAEYTVKVEGLAADALTVKVKVEAEKVAEIEFTSDKAALTRGNTKVITTGYKVTNQYGETINGTTLSATAGKGTATPSNGTLTVAAATDFVLGEKVVLSLVHSGGTFATATVEVGSVAQVASVAITQLYNADSKELVAGNTDDFRLVLDLKDQYGSSVTSTTYLQDDIIVTVSNPTAATLVGYASNTATFNNTLDIDGTKYVNLTVDSPRTAGTSTVMLISKSTGAKASFDIVVKEEVKVGTLTLSAPASAPASVSTTDISTINIPYTAVDQFGAVIKHPTNAMITSSSQSAVAVSGDMPTFVKDIVKDVTNLQVKLPTTKGALIITIISGTQVAQLTIDVTDAKVATVISGIKDLDTAILKDGAVTLGTGNVVVKDQYSNDITPTWGTANGNYRVAIDSSSTGKVSLTPAGTAAIADGTTSTILTGVDKGSSTITLKLQKNDSGTWKDVDNSSYSFTEKVVDKGDITEYTATIDGKVLKEGAADYSRTLTVKGAIADGSSVTVTNSVYNYVVDEANLPTGVTYAAGKFTVDTNYADTNFGDKQEATVNVVVIIKGANGQEVKTVELIASKAGSVATTLAVNASGIASKVSDNVISVDAGDINVAGDLAILVNAAVETKDQYGVVIADSYTVYDSNYSASDRNSVTSVISGDTFNVTVVAGGKTLTLKVIVK
ncbi:MAG: S-layer homology domain-containing protein [Paenibacillaceae bacterium]